MKIKEVIAQTDLTDRAIRLYIENGLITPSCDESYTGRKNFNFSADDVENLKNIATLRKADFSLSEIKSITESTENCKAVLEAFVKKKTEKIESDSKIVEALSPLLSSEEPDINIICEKLNAVTADRTVPEKDTKVPLFEKIEKYFFHALACVGIVSFVLFVIYNTYLIFGYHEIKYPHFYFKEFHYMYFFCALPLLIPVFFFLVYRKHFTRKLRILRTLISLLLSAAMIWGIYFSSAYSLLNIMEPFCSSQTDNPSHYLDVDKSYGDIADIFPENLPEYADKEKVEKWRPERYPRTTEYYYRYVKSNDYYSEMYAQWHIPDSRSSLWGHIENPPYDELELLIEKYKNKQALNGKEPVFKTKGTWNLIYYKDYTETDFSEDYEYIIFAYNKNRRLVRFIQAQNGAGKCGGNGDVVPRYMTLDWYS